MRRPSVGSDPRRLPHPEVPMHRFTQPVTGLLPLALLVTAAHALPQTAAPTRLTLFSETEAIGSELHAQVEGAAGAHFAVLAHAPGLTGTDVLRQGRIVGIGALDDDGRGSLSRMFDLNVVQDLDAPVAFTSIHRTPTGVGFSHQAEFLVGLAGPACDVLDFNYTLGDDSTMVAGRPVDEQWSDAGMHISAANGNPLHPNTAILFDSANPTGDDPDLLTPNLGSVGNTEALGHVLILAENDVDAGPVDGLVDEPDDELAGGSFFFDFDDGAAVCSITVIDLDEAPGSELRFYRNGNTVTPDVVMPLLSLGDNSVQTINFHQVGVTRFEVFFKGSGGIGPIEMIPCPRRINFDETPLGTPLDHVAGQEITNQFQSVGLTVSAVNLGVGPDKAILFDTSNPTGGDLDLLTPNPMVPSNNEALDMVLIIAENDIDVAPMDGIVDDPDDEAGGGVLTFAFDHDVTFLSARVLDVDGTEVDVFRFLDAGGVEIQSMIIPDQPDGNVQLVSGPVTGVRTIVLELGGSGAITRLRVCPELPSFQPAP